MIKYEFEDNWARNVLDLCVRYSLPLNDENVRLLSKGVWKSMVKKQVKTYAFSQLTEECSYNRKTWHLKFETFHLSAYLALLPPDVARVILRARLHVLDLKVNFKKKINMTIILIVHFAVQNQRSLITFLCAQLAFMHQNQFDQ